MAIKRKAAPIAISMGDPAGIGAEIILKAAGEIGKRRRAPKLVVIGDIGAMRAAIERVREGPEPRPWETGCPVPLLREGLAVLSVGELAKSALRPGHPTADGANSAYNYIVAAVKMALAGEVSAMVTAPISKEWLNRAGHHFPGHSELIARAAKTRLWRMMFAGERLRLALVTVHIGLAKVPRALNVDGVFQTISLLAHHLREQLGFKRPRVAVLGLNPHAGEGGLFGQEETRVILPAIRRARRAGIDAYGPLPPDTAFARLDKSFGFDAAVAMYHDQGLIALKALEFERAVNVTLGLPFVRTSPDHGTAFEIAGSNQANASSMIAAIDYAWRTSRGNGSA